ncbi:hypothetical protein [Kaarinaea lacus]
MSILKKGRQSLIISAVASGLLVLAPITRAADEHSHHDHSAMDHSQTAQAGQHVHHAHGKGSWMIEVQLMRMDMDGLLRGSDSVSTRDISGALANPTPPPAAMKRPDLPYMMSPTTMTMDMGMLMGMYGFTDKWTGMLMLNYLQNDMDMIMHMYMEPTPGTYMPMMDMTGSMETSGVGDTEVGAMYTINKEWTAALSLSIPTGSIDEKVDMTMCGVNLVGATVCATNNGMPGSMQAPYAMQLGTGTYDFIPAVTYKSYAGSWTWGGQAEWRIHTGTNDNEYTWGDRFEIDAWGKYAINNTWGVGARLDYLNADSISGKDPNINPMMAPTSDPANYGGSRADLSLGITAMTGGHTFGLMYGVPVYQDVNGIQMEVKSIWSLSYQYMMM